MGVLNHQLGARISSSKLSTARKEAHHQVDQKESQLEQMKNQMAS